MWNADSEQLRGGRVTRVAMMREKSPLRFSEVLDLWREDHTFREFFSDYLSKLPYGSFRWETPPITNRTVDRPFEFVAIDAPNLERAVDANAFANQFRAAGALHSVLTFPNLRGDAIMIVPAPRAQVSAYGHLGAFLRLAPPEQCDQLWQAIANAIELRLGTAPLWLSTAGMGVAWLHVRIDSRPKYYAHQPYCTMK
ncbi:DUF6940 family protein [Planctomycetes bacterium Pan216]